MTKHQDTGNIKAIFVEVETEEDLERGLAKNGEVSDRNRRAAPARSAVLARAPYYTAAAAALA